MDEEQKASVESTVREIRRNSRKRYSEEKRYESCWKDYEAKNMVNLQNYYLPIQLEIEIASFVHYYNHERYHESLNNLTPADVCFGRAKEVLTKRTASSDKACSQGACIRPQHNPHIPGNHTLVNASSVPNVLTTYKHVLDGL